MPTTIKVNDVEYNIPTSWSDITLKQQCDISEMSKREEAFRTLYMISVYTGIDMDLLKKMNISQFKAILALMSFLSEPPKGKSIKSFDIDGHTYYLADSLLRGETQDFLSIEGVLKKYADNQTKALPYIIAITCKRKGETLDSFEVEDRAHNVMMNLSFQTATDIWFFFVQTEKYYSKNIKAYLAVQDKALEASLSYTESSMKKLVGLVWYKRFLRTILLLYVQYIRKGWKSFYRTSLSRISEANSTKEFKTK